MQKIHASLPPGSTLQKGSFNIARTPAEAAQSKQDAALAPDARVAQIADLLSDATPAQQTHLQRAAQGYDGASGLSWRTTAQNIMKGTAGLGKGAAPSGPPGGLPPSGSPGPGAAPHLSATQPPSTTAESRHASSASPTAPPPPKTYTPDGSPFPEDDGYAPTGHVLPFDEYPESMRGKSHRQIDKEYDESWADSKDRRTRRLTEPDLVMSHYIERHGEHLTDQQLIDRCIWGKDPITGTTQDGDHAGEHIFSRHATKFKTRRSLKMAFDKMVNSDEYRAATGDPINVLRGRFEIKITLGRVFDANYTRHVHGMTRNGAPKTASASADPTSFANGGDVVMRGKLDRSGNWVIVTMYPNPN